MELSITLRGQIIALIDSGMSQAAVGRQLGTSQQNVSRTLKRYREKKSLESRSRSGRPPVTTPTADRLMHRGAAKNPFISSKELAQQIPGVSARTVRRRLNGKFHLKSRRPAKKPLLSAKNIKDRLSFCKKYLHWTPNDWSKVLFSDETMIRQFCNIGVQRVRRPKGLRFDPHYCLPVVKHSPSLMIWGSMAASGRGNIWFLPSGTTMKAENYLKVLQERLKPMMDVRGATYFMHDGAPCHKGKQVMSWLANEEVRILGPWPGNSPDLNPIENLWAILKSKVANYNTTSVEELKKVVTRVWCTEITSNVTEKLVKNMPDRLRNVIKNKGRHVKY